MYTGVEWFVVDWESAAVRKLNAGRVIALLERGRHPTLRHNATSLSKESSILLK